MSDPDFKRDLKKIRRAIIPVGSLEQHGPHLPVSTDSLISEYVARMVASRVGAFVLPVIPYGVSFEHEPMFAVSLRNSTLSAMVCDACASIAAAGGGKIKDIVILNGHHGNMGALQYIAQDFRERVAGSAGTGAATLATCVHTLHYWHALKNEFDHAGEVETSLVLAIAPELVRMDLAVPSSNKKLLSLSPKSKAAYSSMTSAPGSFPRITGNGVWGNPAKASAEKGRRWIEEIVNGLSQTVAELSSAASHA